MTWTFARLGKIFLMTAGLNLSLLAGFCLQGGESMFFKKAAAQETVELPEFTTEGGNKPGTGFKQAQVHQVLC